MEIPTTSEVVVVTDDPVIAAAASLTHAQERTYLPVFESPRMGRSDDANEVTRCAEAIIRLQPSKVRDCMVLRMHDGNLVPFLNMLSGQNNPVVLNNACSSWHEFSTRFIYAGARAYIGTLFPVVDAEAQEFVGCLFGRHIHHSLARAVWRAQSDIYADGRNPYVLVGAPFSLMRRGTTHPEQFLLKRLEYAIREGRRYITSQPDRRLQESAQRLNLYLEEEYRALAQVLKRGRS